MLGGLEAGVPPKRLVRFQDLDKLNFGVDGDSEEKAYLEEDALEGANAFWMGRWRVWRVWNEFSEQ